MRVSEIFHGEALSAADLQGRDVALSIEKWAVKEFEDKGKKDTKIELHFRETDRTLICNKTNANAIGEFLKDEELDHWVGAKIVLYPTRTDYQGKQVDCIRVKSAVMPKGVVVPVVAEVDENEVPF